MRLSTDTYIDALTRFISRRGLCSDFFTDCGTNFTGAALKLNNAVIIKMITGTLSRPVTKMFKHPLNTNPSTSN